MSAGIVLTNLFVSQKLDPITQEPTDQEVTMMDVYQEFNSAVASEIGLKEFKSRKVTKSYCFNLPDIPAQCDYLEVKYSVSATATHIIEDKHFF